MEVKPGLKGLVNTSKTCVLLGQKIFGAKKILKNVVFDFLSRPDQKLKGDNWMMSFQDLADIYFFYFFAVKKQLRRVRFLSGCRQPSSMCSASRMLRLLDLFSLARLAG